MVEQSTAASHSLAQETEALSALIGGFKIGEGAQAVPSAPRKSPVSNSTARQASAAPRRSMLQALTGRGSNLAVKPAAPTEDSWEEF
jgi:methyl-accepting chemotaxis protein